MTGVTDNIERILPVLSGAECLKGWTLVGGTALAIQIGHRESEDLDFMKWNYRGDCSVDWPSIKKELTEKFGCEPEMELLGHDQVQFFINGVKLSFYIADCRNPLKDTVPFMGNIILADIDSIAVMKMELALTRGKYRDYYDLYCIFKDRQDIVPMATETSRYTGHTIKSKFILSTLTNTGKSARNEDDIMRQYPLKSLLKKIRSIICDGRMMSIPGWDIRCAAISTTHSIEPDMMMTDIDVSLRIGKSVS